MQNADTGWCWYLPFGHLTHADRSATSWYQPMREKKSNETREQRTTATHTNHPQTIHEPFGHSTHLRSAVFPSSLYRPAPHTPQNAAPVSSGCVESRPVICPLLQPTQSSSESCLSASDVSSKPLYVNAGQLKHPGVLPFALHVAPEPSSHLKKDPKIPTNTQMKH